MVLDHLWVHEGALSFEAPFQVAWSSIPGWESLRATLSSPAFRDPKLVGREKEDLVFSGADLHLEKTG